VMDDDTDRHGGMNDHADHPAHNNHYSIHDHDTLITPAAAAATQSSSTAWWRWWRLPSFQSTTIMVSAHDLLAVQHDQQQQQRHVPSLSNHYYPIRVCDSENGNYDVGWDDIDYHYYPSSCTFSSTTATIRGATTTMSMTTTATPTQRWTRALWKLAKSTSTQWYHRVGYHQSSIIQGIQQVYYSVVIKPRQQQQHHHHHVRNVEHSSDDHNSDPEHPKSAVTASPGGAAVDDNDDSNRNAIPLEVHSPDSMKILTSTRLKDEYPLDDSDENCGRIVIEMSKTRNERTNERTNVGE
jgi:hypothetical protein